MQTYLRMAVRAGGPGVHAPPPHTFCDVLTALLRNDPVPSSCLPY
jgi:hypothetical protein